MQRNRFLRHSVIIAISLQLIFSSLTFNTVYADYELSVAPVSEAFSDYIENGGNEGGYIPSPISIKKSTVTPKVRLYGTDPLPTSYAPAYQSSVKNQYVSGPCWAFASLSSLESYLIKNGQPEYNFSERNMINNHGYDLLYSDGGNRETAVSYLAKWGGPMYETDDYVYYPPSSSTVGYDESKTRKHVQDVIYIPDKDYEGIKRAIMEYGSVSTSIYYDDASYNSTSRSHFYNGAELYGNHGITIVGWDDSFSKTSFNTQPSYDGAFICKNSWGTGYGNAGYFYVSYYDKLIGIENYAFTSVEEVDNYDNIYQYDPLGLVNATGFYGDGIDQNTAVFANVFTASESDFEKLSAVSFYSLAENSSYEIQTVSSFDGENIDNEEFTTQKAGTLAKSGYHTIKLDTPISLTSGEKFIVAVKLTAPGNIYPIPYETSYSGSYTSAASANPGESFVRPDDEKDEDGYYIYDWSDFSASGLKNVCLKAFTDIIPPSDISAENLQLKLNGQNVSQAEFSYFTAPVTNISLTTDIVNNLETPLDATLVLAIYKTIDGKDMLQEIRFSSQEATALSIPAGHSKNYSLYLAENNIDITLYKIKIMFWNTISGCKPYIENLIY